MNRREQARKTDSAVQLQRFASERANEQARRIPWQRLAEARNQYIDWQEFYLWVRSILETEASVPVWLKDILNDRCPGFLARDDESGRSDTKPLPLRLEEWIDDHVFGFVEAENWFAALTFYALRDPRYQRAEVCWSESVAKWRKAKPIRYPSFEQWKRDALQCDEDAHLLPGVREARAARKLVEPGRLAEAVRVYIDWEAFACWLRPAFAFGRLPAEAVRALAERCPGFLPPGGAAAGGDGQSLVADWDRLMQWIGDALFQEAKTEGWFDAILLEARNHPRAIRTLEYAEHCEEVWSSQPPARYPSFEEWRWRADAHVAGGDGDPVSPQCPS